MTYIRTTYIGQASGDPHRGWMTLSATHSYETLQETLAAVKRIYGGLSVYTRIVKRTEEVVWTGFSEDE